MYEVTIKNMTPFAVNVILTVPQLVSSLDSRLNSTGEVGNTSEAGRYQFFLDKKKKKCEVLKANY